MRVGHTVDMMLGCGGREGNVYIGCFDGDACAALAPPSRNADGEHRPPMSLAVCTAAMMPRMFAEAARLAALAMQSHGSTLQ
jgi:hypothetical protein